MKLQRVEDNIYRHPKTGAYKGQVMVGTKPRVKQEAKWFASDETLPFIRNWCLQKRAELAELLLEEVQQGAAPAKPVRGTFETDLEIRFKQIQGRVGFKADRSHLRAWVPFIGKLRRPQVKSPVLQIAIGSWQAAGRKPKTIRHRVRVLREMWQGLDGPRARPPIVGLTLPKVADPEPVAVPLATIRKVALSLKAGARHAEGYGSDCTLAYARFCVLVLTGQRPCQVMRAVRTHLDFRHRVWKVQSAKGGKPVEFPLDAPHIAAWRFFIAVDAFGKYDCRSFSKTLQRHGWPKGVRPYMLRHTFAIEHLRHGTDIGDLQGLLGHRQLETTRKFYAPILASRLRRVIGNRKLAAGQLGL